MWAVVISLITYKDGGWRLNKSRYVWATMWQTQLCLLYSCKIYNIYILLIKCVMWTITFVVKSGIEALHVTLQHHSELPQLLFSGFCSRQLLPWRLLQATRCDKSLINTQTDSVSILDTDQSATIIKPTEPLKWITKIISLQCSGGNFGFWL